MQDSTSREVDLEKEVITFHCRLGNRSFLSVDTGSGVVSPPPLFSEPLTPEGTCLQWVFNLSVKGGGGLCLCVLRFTFPCATHLRACSASVPRSVPSMSRALAHLVVTNSSRDGNARPALPPHQEPSTLNNNNSNDISSE